MKNLKKKFRFRINLKSKHLLAIMTLFCLSCIVATFASGISTAPLQETAGIVIVPFEKSIEKIGSMVRSVRDSFKDKQDLLFENEELKAELDSLTTQNNKLIQDQGEYQRLKELYNLDQTYEDYPKVAATIISKDPGNWYDTFMINKGSDDGIRVDNNVIAGKGLVGIVTEVGSSWATVRSIIDDSSSVSAMTVSTSDNCIVNGDLELIDEGKILHWGISEANEDYLRRADAVCKVTAVENRYSMMARAYETLFPVLEELNVGLVAFSPMANGFLTGKYGSDCVFDPRYDYRSIMPQFSKEAQEKNGELLSLLHDIAEKKQATQTQISLAWMLCKKPYIVPIPGTRKVERMKENLLSAEVILSEKEVNEIDHALENMTMSEVFGGSKMKKN